MKKTILTSLVLSAIGLAQAMPQISNVSVQQDAYGKRNVRVSYELSESAVVTFTVETNAGDNVWAPIDRALLKSVEGNVNKVVAPGENQFVWRARKDWPGQNLGANMLRVKMNVHAKGQPPDYVVVDLLKDTDAVRYYESAQEVPGGVTNDLYKTTSLLMKRIHAACERWSMGAPQTETAAFQTEIAPRTVARIVTLTQDYYIGVYEFTQRQFELVATYEGSTVPSSAPSKTIPRSAFGADKRPVTNVDWNCLRGVEDDNYWPRDGHKVDATRLFGLLRARYSFQFDLPTAAQWEYAYRAGTRTAFFTGADIAGDVNTYGTVASKVMNDYAWCMFNNSEDTEDEFDYGPDGTKSTNAYVHIVGLKKPNPWGLYDIAGNVNELCLDWFIGTTNTVYATVPVGEAVDPTGPVGPNKGFGSVNRFNAHVWRGGSCVSGGQCGHPGDLRAAGQYTWEGNFNGLGFRICCPAVAY